MAAYQPLGNAFDEFMGPDGQTRPAWRSFARFLEGLSPADLAERENQLARLVNDHGITYNQYAEEDSQGRPWSMDLLPIILDHEEALGLEAALNQRARLLSAIRADIYGPQDLAAAGHLPPHLLFANPRFLRPLVGSPSEIRPLHLYAVDLARAPDGSWWVLNDRLEAAAGLGYTLENRSLSSRVFPTLLRGLGVQSLQPFLDALGEAQSGLAPQQKEEPRVVLLTPGPAHESFHEQSFLARNLGYALAEGTDLLVRDGRVHLKTIQGIQPVDVVVRRVEGSWCDPLELRSESLLGVPGLVDVTRQGRVAVANSLGAGVLEIAALPAFLPGLARHILGEDLALPSAATWWCGQATERDYVLEHLEQLVVRPTFREGAAKLYRPVEMSSASRERLRQRILAEPTAFTAHEPVARGTAPAFEHGRLVPREYVLRTFLVGQGDSWKMLPGGLARMGSGFEPVSFMMQAGESKDVWVLPPPSRAEAPVVALPPNPGRAVSVRRGAHALSSRVADNLCWMGRYAERTESLARTLRILLDGFMAEEVATSDQALVPFFGLLLDGKAVANLFNEEGHLQVEAVGKALSQVIRDPRNPSSLVGNLQSLQRVSSNAKERLSPQMWQQVQRLAEFQRVLGTRRPAFCEESRRLLDEILESLAGLAGLTNENMSRGDAWLFLELGRRMERATHTARLLRLTLGSRTAEEEERMRHVLVCADTGMSYRRRYLSHFHVVGVLDLLLTEKANPRSVAFQLAQVEAAFRALPVPGEGVLAARELDRLLLACTSQLGLADLDALATVNAERERSYLNAFLEELERGIAAIAVAIEHRFFAHAAPLHALGGWAADDNA